MFSTLPALMFFPRPYRRTLYHGSLLAYGEEMRLALCGVHHGHLKYDYVTWQSEVYHWQWSMRREGCDCQCNAFILLRLWQTLAMRGGCAAESLTANLETTAQTKGDQHKPCSPQTCVSACHHGFLFFFSSPFWGGDVNLQIRFNWSAQQWVKTNYTPAIKRFRHILFYISIIEA